MKDEYDFSNAVRGPVVRIPPGKTRITIRLDEEVINWFKAKVHAMGGGNYQTLMNAALRAHIASEREPLEETLRRVVREELQAATPSTQVSPPPTMRAKTKTTKVAAERASKPRGA